jgi:UDP-glucose 4,6-dehydratase
VCAAQTRPWPALLLSFDTAEIQRWVRLQGEIGEVYNIGTQKERTVMDVAHQIAKIFKLPEVCRSDYHRALDSRWPLAVARDGGPSMCRRCSRKCSQQRNPCFRFQGKIIKVKDRAFNDQRYFICDQKLAGLGWTERTSWEEGLKVTIDWYLKNGFSSYWEHGDVEVLSVFPICYARMLNPCCA